MSTEEQSQAALTSQPHREKLGNEVLLSHLQGCSRHPKLQPRGVIRHPVSLLSELEWKQVALGPRPKVGSGGCHTSAKG